MLTILRYILVVLLVGVHTTAHGQALLCEQPNVLVVLDRSGSMTTDGRWSTSKLVIREVVESFATRLRFGLDLFPSLE